MTLERRFLMSALLLFASMATTAVALAQQTPSLAKKVDAYVQPFVDAKMVSGLVIGIAQPGQHQVLAYGDALTPGSDKASAKRIYEIGSITKVFTGILLADAVTSGQLKLDQTLGSVLPEVAEANPKAAATIRLWHLATHASGLPRLPSNWAPKDPDHPYVDYDRGKLIAALKNVELVSEPGTASGYSNFAVAALGEILAIKSSTSYGNLLHDKILKPLAMDDTYVEVPSSKRSRLATPHRPSGNTDVYWQMDAFAGAGAICSTASDMLKFIDAQLHPPQGSLGKAIELAWNEQLAGDKNRFAMGLGWHIARDGSTRWHNGQTGGFHSMMMVSRSFDAGVIVLSNTAAPEIDVIGESVIRMIAGNEPMPLPVIEYRTPIAEETLERLQGSYEIAPGFALSFTANHGRLYIQATDQPELLLSPKSDVEWTVHGVDARIVFELPETGNAPTMTLFQNGLELRGVRL